MWNNTCNASNEKQVEATVKAAFDTFGRLDILVNSAGLMQFNALDKLTGDDWTRLLNVDLMGNFVLSLTRSSALAGKPNDIRVNGGQLDRL